ncbi:FecR family protein [Thalassospiraceae bacterium LMO-JJ14]|nr:FecR family protein [Thalassospiraceae bacterium LMO-JJ14]
MTSNSYRPRFWAATTLALALVFAAGMTVAGEKQATEQATELASIEQYVGMDVGEVIRARGNIASVFQSLPRTLGAGSDVKFLDTILTGENTRAEITLIDDSLLSLGDNSELTIDEMIYAPGKKGRGVLTLAKGVFRMVSGKINKHDGGTLTLKTPIATIGVRGTDFWGLQEANTLTMALIDDGIVEITGADGRTVTLNTPLQAVVIERGQPTPAAPFNLTPGELAEAAKTVTY